jgi:hypothetical protein
VKARPFDSAQGRFCGRAVSEKQTGVRGAKAPLIYAANRTWATAGNLRSASDNIT